MKKVLASIIVLSLSSASLQADITQPESGPPTPPTSPQGSDTFGTLVQQNTSQALATFQGVDYKTLSGNQDQNYFFQDNDDDDNSNNVSTIVQKFTLAPEN